MSKEWNATMSPLGEVYVLYLIHACFCFYKRLL